MVWSQKFGETPITSISMASGQSTNCSPSRRSGAPVSRHLAFRAVEESLYHPQHIRGAEDHTERRDDGPAMADTCERARQDQEFTDESIQERQADHGE